MFKQVTAAALAGMLLTLSGCGRDTGWTNVSEDHPEIVAAKQEAKDRYGEFVDLVKRRQPGAVYAVEVLYTENGKSEVLALDVQAANEEEITGMIIGYPQQVDKLNSEVVTVPADTVIDWRVDTPDGEVIGGFVSDVRARLQRPDTGG